MTVLKVASTNLWAHQLEVGKVLIQWLSDNISPRQHQKYVWPRTKHAPQNRVKNKRFKEYCQYRNMFAHEIGHNLDVTGMHFHKGKGWRLYAVTHIVTTRNETSTSHSAHFDIFVKIFDVTKAIQFKLAAM